MQLTRFIDYSIRVLTHQSIQMTNVFAQANRAFLAVLDQYTIADMMTRGNQLHRLFSAATSAGGSARS